MKHEQPHRWHKGEAYNLRVCPGAGTSHPHHWGHRCIRPPRPMPLPHPRCGKHRPDYATRCGRESGMQRRPPCRLSNLAGYCDVTRRFMRVRNISEYNEAPLPGMVKRVEPALVWPWVCGWVETNLSGRGRVYFTDKWKCSVQVGVPGKRASSKERCRNEGCSGIDQRLGCPSGIRYEGSWALQTWNALGDAALEDANLACRHEREQPNSETWWQHPKNRSYRARTLDNTKGCSARG